MIKKILFVIGIIGNGGAERVIAALANRLIENNIEVGVATIYSTRQDYQLNPRIELKHILANNRIKVIRPIERVIKLRQFIKDYNPDCVISFLADVNIHVILACRTCNIPLIVSERNDPSQDPQQKWMRKVRNLMYRKVDGLVLQTNDAEKYFCDKVPKNVCKIVIPNPITPGLPYYNGNVVDNRLITACRLNSQKNLKMMIDAVRIANQAGTNCSLDIYGDGPLKNELQDYIDNNNMSNIVKLKGFSNSIHEEMLLSKGFLISSNYEGISNSMLEALAIGIPVIATDCPIGGARMFISHKENGWLTTVGNAREFSEAIIELLNDYDKAISYGKKAMDIRNMLDVEIICQAWKEFIGIVLKDVEA